MLVVAIYPACTAGAAGNSTRNVEPSPGPDWGVSMQIA